MCVWLGIHQDWFKYSKPPLAFNKDKLREVVGKVTLSFSLSKVKVKIM
jgi:hypothetical protein